MNNTQQFNKHKKFMRESKELKEDVIKKKKKKKMRLQKRIPQKIPSITPHLLHLETIYSQRTHSFQKVLG